MVNQKSNSNLSSEEEIKLINTGEEFLCHNSENLKLNKDGTINVEGRILIYTNIGTFSKVVEVKLEK